MQRRRRYVRGILSIDDQDLINIDGCPQEKDLYKVTFDALRTQLEGVDAVIKLTRKSEINAKWFQRYCK